MLDAEPQGGWAVEIILVVLRPPDSEPGAQVDLERRVEHQRRGRIAVVERCGVDERLERGAGLAQRLGSAAELALVVGEAADHGEDAPGPRILDHHRARDFRDLVQAVLAGQLRRLHIYHVADVEHLTRLGDRLTAGLRPFQAFKRNDANVAYLADIATRLTPRLQADARRLVGNLQHHRKLPGRNIRQRLDIGELHAPVAGHVDLGDRAAPALRLVET